MIIHQLKPFKHYIYYTTDKLDGVHEERQATNANCDIELLITSKVGKVYTKTKNLS